MNKRIVSRTFGLIFVAAVGVAWLQHNAIYDWLRLRNYTPPLAVTQLADTDSMTAYARHLFYVNRPAVQVRGDFNLSCPNNGGEQTIILGCYHSHQTGIYVYSVTDAKLNGVEEVTAAHEDLHAIYDRLSTKDRNYVNSLLLSYYQNDLHDQRLIDTIEAYKKSEPNDVVNEMHSVFGTEASNLPPALEQYYSKYFTNRATIVSYSQQYEQTFTNMKAQATQVSAQIKDIENQLNNYKSQIDQLQSSLTSERQYLESNRDTSDVAQYNSRVDAYNTKLASYQSLISTYNKLVVQHNQLVNQYQAIAVETNQLIQELNSRTPTVSAP